MVRQDKMTSSHPNKTVINHQPHQWGGNRRRQYYDRQNIPVNIKGKTEHFVHTSIIKVLLCLN